MNSLFGRLCAFLFLLLAPCLVHAATLNVPTTAYPTIQAGINAAHDGDTVLVADGTYTGSGNHDIDFNGKNITVTSQHGASKTIIDCQGTSSNPHRGFYIHNGETNAVIDGLTIRNGYKTYVSGVTDSGNGGGICIAGASAAIKNCTVSGNTATDGGGINGTISVTNCTISVTNCAVSGNTAQYYGGGICNSNYIGTISVTNCTVSGNTAPDGGGIYNSNDNGTISVTNCTVSGNTAGDGGGIFNDNYNYNSKGTISVTNCTVSGNTAQYYGGGIYNINDTYNYNGTDPISIMNAIIYGDVGGEVYNNPSGSANIFVTFCDVKGGYAGTGNIDADPLFVNAAGGDYHLSPGSPCIGAGTHTGAPATDLDGVARHNPPSIGAYELETSLPTSALHMPVLDNTATPPVVAVGIVCDNVSGMALGLKDSLVLTLPDYPAAVVSSVSIVNDNSQRTTTDDSSLKVPNVGTCDTSTDGQVTYYPPDEANYKQQAGSAADLFGAATRTVKLTVHLTSGGKAYVVKDKSIVLARPPVVLVHGINNNYTVWDPFVNAISAKKGRDGKYLRFPFTRLDHSNQDNGNGPVEYGASLLAGWIDTVKSDVLHGKAIPETNASGSPASFTDYQNLPLQIKRVDAVAWSYGGVITRWYIASTGSTSSKDWYVRSFSSASKPTVRKYNNDIRKVITLGSMWRGVPFINYNNEALFSQNDAKGFYYAPIAFQGIATLGDFIKTTTPIKDFADKADMEVMAINSPWLSQMIYQEPFRTPGTGTPKPFNDNIGYGSVAGDNDLYPITYKAITVGADPYVALQIAQKPTWFDYLKYEYETNPLGTHNYSDGLIPLWSSAIPGSYDIVPSTHNGYATDADTQNYVVQWLSNSSLPRGKQLNKIWQTPNNVLNSVSDFSHDKIWQFDPTQMAPSPESDCYTQASTTWYGRTKAVGRITPGYVVPQ